MSTFVVAPEGVFVKQDGHREKVCDQPLEFVAYSRLDDAYYVRWPADGSFHHMAMVPGAVIAAGGRSLRQWCERNGLHVRRGKEQAVIDYLREQAEEQGS